MRQDSLFNAVQEIIIRMHIDFGKPQPAADVSEATALSWTEHLRKSGVGWAQVQMLYDDAVKARALIGSGFMPTIADLLAAWKAMIDAGYYDNLNQQPARAALPTAPPDPNAPGFRLFKMNRARWSAGLDAACCNCTDKDNMPVAAGLTRDGQYLCCALRNCDFRWPAKKFLEVPVHPQWQPVGDFNGVDLT